MDTKRQFILWLIVAIAAVVLIGLVGSFLHWWPAKSLLWFSLVAAMFGVILVLGLKYGIDEPPKPIETFGGRGQQVDLSGGGLNLGGTAKAPVPRQPITPVLAGKEEAEPEDKPSGRVIEL